MLHDNPYLSKPGVHTYNLGRLTKTIPPARSGVATIRAILLLAGVACLGYYAYTFADQKVYQVYQNWAFDQQIAGRQAVTFKDYIREETPFGFLAGNAPLTRSAPLPSPSIAQTAPAIGNVIGRLTIGRLNLSAVVREGVDDQTLREAVGHVPSSALPGQAGNFAIAAHRDTLFRALKDIQEGDAVTFQSPTGMFTYEVIGTKIVMPSDVSVLRPDGGGLVAMPGKLLTMITCYPFYYVGSAPKRFVVEARLVTSTSVPPPRTISSKSPMLEYKLASWEIVQW